MKHTFFAPFLLLFAVSSLQAQELVVRGSIVDGESLEALRDVHVYVELTHGTYADIDGNFAILASIGDTLHFSSLGYQIAKIGINDSTETQNMIISLKRGTVVLDDVQINSMYQANTIIKNPRQQTMEVSGVVYNEKTEADDYHLGVAGSIFSPAEAVYRMTSKKYKQQKRVYQESQVREKQDEKYELAKKKMDEVLEIIGERLDEYYYLDFIHYSGMTLDTFSRRNVYELVQIMPNSLDRYYEYLDEKLKKEERIKNGGEQNPTFH
ncbi:hypothetical protein BFP72_16630 [Reichenbachiella sp. 5M10]|uniref:carboxypeptidase-like regulatory domain-containing protein n=1 Tax=Reichenbachiella sp. 5M10 TaxID=1889772 RepID=UPI000C15E78F|nr:carboxypeptidase-like regulatory domain-containing protein [Reichenbachiella sp. 5M10]PIB36912.1 hypothetical protein BFP72_16630 [Reichenbachiella sp. 5M10]